MLSENSTQKPSREASPRKRLRGPEQHQMIMIVCDFWLTNYEEMAALLSPVWGKEVKAQELKIAGERIWNLGRLFNIREGFSRKDDKLPSKFFAHC